MESFEDRNIKIFLERCSGRTLTDIAQRYGISSERVRCICAKFERKAIKHDWIKAKYLEEIACLKEEIRRLKMQIAEEEKTSSLEVLGLSARSLRVLTDSGIKSVEHLSLMTDQEILSLPGLGRKSLNEIRSLRGD